MPPALLAVLPGLALWLPGTGDRVGAPSSLAGVEVGGLDEAANAVFAASGADNGEIANDQRRNGQRLTQSGIDDLALPHDLAGRLVDGEHSPVQRDRDHLVLPQRNAAVVDAAAGDVTRPGPIGAGIHFPFDDAFLAAGDVDGIHRPPAVGCIEDAILDQGRRFEIAEGIASAALEAAQRHRERRPKVLDGVGVDISELGEAMALIIAVMENPVLGLALRIERALLGHVGGVGRREHCRHQQ